MIYVLSIYDWESYSPTYLEGPETNWQELCKELIDEAAELAIGIEKKSAFPNSVSGFELKRTLLDLLFLKGYREVKFDDFAICNNYWSYLDEPKELANSVGLKEEVAGRVLMWNKERRNKFMESLKENRR